MTTRVLRLGLALIVAVLGSPGLALAASAASTTDLACPDGSNRLADFAVQGDGFVATTGAAAVSVIGSGRGGTFRVEDTTQAVTAVLVAGPDGPVATKIDNYSGGTSSGSFDPASFVSDDGTPATVTSVSFCGGAAAISSAQCQDQPAFSSTWDGAGTFSVTLAGTLALCEAVEFHVGSYALDAPAGWDGQSSFSPGATPQTEFDHHLIVFSVGDAAGHGSARQRARGRVGRRCGGLRPQRPRPHLEQPRRGVRLRLQLRGGLCRRRGAPCRAGRGEPQCGAASRARCAISGSGQLPRRLTDLQRSAELLTGGLGIILDRAR